MQVPELKLNSGNTIPQIGLGTWLIKNKRKCMEAVSSALEAGYRHFDTAQIYENEQFVGQALKESGVAREELFITTKIWTENMYWDDLMESFDESLEKLQTDYVDLLLLHFPVTELRRPAWRRMEELHKAGRSKSIGVSNYLIKHLEELLSECKVRPAVNQVELHVYLQQPELVEYCAKNDILIEAYSPLAHGYDFDNPAIAKIAQKHHKSPAQIMIRWTVEKGTVTLPKSSHPDRIKENIDVFDFKLDKEDMAEIAKLNEDLRTCWDPTHVQ